MNALEKRFIMKLKAERDQARRKAEGLNKVVMLKTNEVKQLVRRRASAINELV